MGASLDAPSAKLLHQHQPDEPGPFKGSLMVMRCQTFPSVELFGRTRNDGRGDLGLSSAFTTITDCEFSALDTVS
jgi:hypothetical protein